MYRTFCDCCNLEIKEQKINLERITAGETEFSKMILADTLSCVKQAMGQSEIIVCKNCAVEYHEFVINTVRKIYDPIIGLFLKKPAEVK